MRDLKKQEPAADSTELTSEQLDKASGGGINYTTIQWEYTKQDDTGAAKGTVATKINLTK